MRVKRDFLVVSFPTTAAATACEELCHGQGLPGRMIPVPSQVSAGCGLAWRVFPEERGDIEAALAGAGIPWSGMDVVGLWELVRGQS